ncbi:MAG: ATP-dependent Clp protease proteolytic subunit [Patescibacteria group bacterium]
MMMFPGDGMISQLNENMRRIVISGTISEQSASMFLEQITAFEYMDIAKPVSIYIDTFGGCVDSALLMYDAMKSCCMPVVTIGIGKCMSAGVLLLAAGEKENRFVTPNCRIMIHQISGAVIGNMTEMQNSIDETKRLQDIYFDLLAKETGQVKSKIMNDISSCDYYMSAQESIKYGIADKLVPFRKEQKKIIAKKASKK